MKFRLGNYTLDGERRLLLRAEAEVHLSPKGFELLTLLVEHRPRAMAKSELHQHLWPATFVSEANLASLVAEVREALGDTARQSSFVRTVHRFGYAFCGDAVEIGDQAVVESGETFCWLVTEKQRLPLRPGANILGREPDGGIRVESPTVSRHHARIVVTAGGAMLEDLGSKNGTFLGGEPVSTAVPLRDGDQIRTGSVVFHFRMTSQRGSTATWAGSAS